MDGTTQHGLQRQNADLYAALDGITGKLPELAASLHRQGLTDGTCAIAYRAVFHSTLSGEAAWEAARRQQLLVLRSQQVAHPERGDALAERIAQVAAMPNPFYLDPVPARSVRYNPLPAHA